MPEDLTTHTLELGNGVRLIYPSGYEATAHFFFDRKHVYITDHQNKEFMWIVYPPNTGGKTLSISRSVGLSLQSESISTGDSYGLT